MIPTADEVSAVTEYDGDRTALGKVEQFFLATTQVPRFAQRIQCWVTKSKFDDQVRNWTGARRPLDWPVD